MKFGEMRNSLFLVVVVLLLLLFVVCCILFCIDRQGINNTKLPYQIYATTTKTKYIYVYVHTNEH